MATDSIFEFGDKFGITSPFGDWLGTQEKKLSIRIQGVYHYVDTNKRDKYRVVYLITATNLEAFAGTVGLVQEGIVNVGLLNDEYPSNSVTLRNGTTTAQTDFFREGVESNQNSLEGKPTFFLRLSCDGITVESSEFDLSNAKELPATTSKREKSKPLNCNCGKDLADVFICDVSDAGKGPKYAGSVFKYDRWDAVPGLGAVSDEERIIIFNVAGNEGGYDAVQSYDSEIISVGFFQKTASVSLAFGGEFPQQLHEFNVAYPKVYQCLVSGCGWDVRKIEGVWNLVYSDLKNPKSELYKGASLRKKIREQAVKTKVGYPVTCEMAAAFVALGRNEDFKDKQVLDAVLRLREVMDKKPMGYRNKVKDFLKTSLGRALALDEHVNKQSHVEPYLGLALDKLREEYEDKQVKIPKDPSQWGGKHEEYEKRLIEIYGPLRGKKIVDSSGETRGGMTNGAGRYELLKGKNWSDVP